MKSEQVRNYFENENVVSDYAFAVDRVGLWASEQKIINEYLNVDSEILELGCGAGRISINLAREKFKHLSASDFSSTMIREAKNLAQYYNLKVDFSVEDATCLKVRKDNFFDGVIFGFNGFMQIPHRSCRIVCAKEIFRVLKNGGYFIFTTHDRRAKRNEKYWQSEEIKWKESKKNPKLDEFGDICYMSEFGELFIHSPVEEEIENDLKEAGFTLIFSSWRSLIASENDAVRDFSDDCRFWVFKKIK